MNSIGVGGRRIGAWRQEAQLHQLIAERLPALRVHAADDVFVLVGRDHERAQALACRTPNWPSPFAG